MKTIKLFLTILFFVIAEIGFAQNSTPKNNALDIFIGGSLVEGFDMGVNSSGGRTDWSSVANNEMCMSYPSGQLWGAVFITVGPPVDPPRPSNDYSKYKKLVIELKGKAGETVQVGLKDKDDPDNGKETKLKIKLTGNWDHKEFLLSDFKSADLTKLYVVTEFVFETKPEKVCVRKIQFIK